MTYSPETQALIAAVQSGDCCDECAAPNDQRHFDACGQHPENVHTTSDPWCEKHSDLVDFECPEKVCTPCCRELRGKWRYR